MLEREQMMWLLGAMVGFALAGEDGIRLRLDKGVDFDTYVSEVNDELRGMAIARLRTWREIVTAGEVITKASAEDHLQCNYMQIRSEL